ncbi:hypothetical protein ACFY4C_41325 [Actinomadura viridis]|uniref:hypothetical protein n=1 Tax=Actinomadura viridis TaxID=58110 RepID=UPI00368F3E30
MAADTSTHRQVLPPPRIADDTEPSGTIAVRFSDNEVAAVLDAVNAAVDAARAANPSTAGLALFGERTADAEEVDALMAASRKLSALIGEDVIGLEIRTVTRPAPGVRG